MEAACFNDSYYQYVNQVWVKETELNFSSKQSYANLLLIWSQKLEQVGSLVSLKAFGITYNVARHHVL